jgi:hypothetical protein
MAVFLLAEAEAAVAGAWRVRGESAYPGATAARGCLRRQQKAATVSFPAAAAEDLPIMAAAVAARLVAFASGLGNGGGYEIRNH